MNFNDYFSGHVPQYAQFRPTYPSALFAYLAGIAPSRQLAWDCATGSGQAALGLAELFEEVIASDASAPQISTALPHPGVEYRVASAEQSGLPDHSVDLITVAQALHWFDLTAFFAEAERVLKPCGIFAAWTYDLPTVMPEIDRIVQRFYHETNGPYWPPERLLVDERYRTIPFPWNELAPPHFQMLSLWNLERFLGYIETWSAIPTLVAARGRETVTAFREEVGAAWGDPALEREICWPLTVRASIPIRAVS